MTTLRDKLYAERQLNKHAFGNRPSVSRNEDMPTSNEDPTTDMDTINNQKDLALLNRVADSQFRKIILIGSLNIIILGGFVAALFFLLFLNHKDPHNLSDNVSTPVSSATTVYVHTTNIKSTEITTTSGSDCNPTTPATLLFAYSNDISPSHIEDACDWIYTYFTSLKIIYFANIRFDTTIDDPIYFHTDKFYFTESVKTYLPDVMLSLPSQRTESNVLNVIRKFLANQEYPLCGSILYILMKRLPNTKDISDLIQQLQQLHIFVYTVTDTNSFGGTDQSLMCEITHATNGFCDFQTTEAMQNEIHQTVLEISRTYQFVSQSYQVSGSGVINASFVRPAQGNQSETMSLVITFQNHGTDDNLKSVGFLILRDDNYVVLSDYYNKSTNGNSFLEHPVLKNDVTYTIYIFYKYGERGRKLSSYGFIVFLSESLQTENNSVDTSDELKSEFEPVNQQHHLVLFHRVAISQFRKIVLIALLNVIILSIFAGVLFVLVFMEDKSPHSNDKEGTSTTVSQLTSTTGTQLTSTTVAQFSFTTVPSFSPLLPDACTPRSNSTFLFAYSNDLPFDLIENAHDWIQEFISNKKIVCFANRRFDSTDDIIHFHKSRQEFGQSVSAFMPNSALRFSSRDNGSDVLSLIPSFLTNEECPLCGSIVYIVMKRYPNLEDTSDLIQQLRQHHIFVYTVTDTSPSGGSEQSLMCEITRATNGFCDFQTTENLQDDVYQTIRVLSRVYQIVTKSYLVSGQGRVNIPLFNRPLSIVVTFQNRGRDTNFQSSNYTIVDNSLEVKASKIFTQNCGNSVFDHPILQYNVTYQLSVNYAYGSHKTEVLEVKMYSSDPVDYWLPYPDF